MDYKKYYTTNDTNKAGLTAFVALDIMEYGFEPTDPLLMSAFQCID